jgi:uncharacterized membrane protein YebE (DUF533 family)
MSMVSTLAKVAAGALVARGVSGMMRGGSQGGGGGGLGGMLGGMLGGQGGAGGGLGGMLGGGGQGGAGGGLGGMLGGMLGGGQQQQSGGGMGAAAGAGGLGGMLGGMLAGKGQQGGGIGGLLESLGGQGNPQAPANAPAPQSGSMGSVLNSAFENFGEPEQLPTPDQEDQARLFLRAMISAAKSDGQIDQEEKQKILGELGDVDPEEVAFVQAELAAPLDVDGLVRDTPAGAEQQVYLMALMGINLDNQAEARFLDALAKGLNLSPEICNAIHDKLGAPKLYT